MLFLPAFIVVICMLPVVLVICNILFGAFAVIVAPIIDFIEGIFGEDIFERTDRFLDIAIWVLGCILTVVVGIIAFTSF